VHTEAYLQWMNMGMFPVLRCILKVSSITATMVLRLEQKPSACQQLMWN